MQPIAFSRPFMGKEEETACAEAVASGWIVGGPQQARFERHYAELCESPFAVAVSSWTTGGFLILKAWGIGPGDEVIVPSLTFIASVNVILHAGATPVFADIDPQTWNIDPEDMARRITSRTRAVIAVDQIGMPCDIHRIQDLLRGRDIRLLQDAACSFGSRLRGHPAGAYSDVSCFSLHARKVVSTGEGGMIVCRGEAFAARLRRLRHQGMSHSDHERHGAPPTQFETYPEVGYNFRLTDIQAAIGNAQLARLPEILRRRKAVADRYIAHLRDHPLLEAPHVPSDCEPNWQSFQARVRDGSPLTRNALMDSLWQRGIPTRRGVMASHREPPYLSMKADLPHTVEAADRCIQLPMHPGLEADQVEFILKSLDGIACI